MVDIEDSVYDKCFDLQTQLWKSGDRVILARLSYTENYYGISEEDFGRSGVVVGQRDDLSSCRPLKYAVLLDSSALRRSKTDHQGRLYTWNVTADQLDEEDGPW